MDQVDQACSERFGLSIHDLPDMLFRDAYESGQDPEEFLSEQLPANECLGEDVFA